MIQRTEDITSDLAGVVCQSSRVASSSIRRQKTECWRGCAAHSSNTSRTAARNHLSSVLCPLSSERGFTLIELVVVVTIIAILYTVFLNRIWFYQERAEKTAMVEIVGALQSALVMQYGRLMVRGKEAEVTLLATDNPMRWLQKVPTNYAGEFYDPQPGSVEPGNWVFDLKSHDLIYVLNRADYFVPGKDGKKWVRFRVNLMYDPVKGVRGKGSKELVGTLFEPVEPYRWFE